MYASMTARPAEVNIGALAIAELTWQMVRRCHAATSIFVLCITILRYLSRIRGNMNDLRTMISSLTFTDDDDRTLLRQPAQELGRVAVAWDATRDRWVTEIAPRLPGNIPLMSRFSSMIEHRLEDLACMSEDAAETLALGASQPFADLVRQNLGSNHSASVRNSESV